MTPSLEGPKMTPSLGRAETTLCAVMEGTIGLSGEQEMTVS